MFIYNINIIHIKVNLNGFKQVMSGLSRSGGGVLLSGLTRTTYNALLIMEFRSRDRFVPPNFDTYVGLKATLKFQTHGTMNG